MINCIVLGEGEIKGHRFITMVVGYERVLYCDIVRCRDGLANEDTMDDYFSVYA